MNNKLILSSLIIFSLILVQPALALSVVHQPSSAAVVYAGNLTNISQMEDVNGAGWADGESLVWNAASGLWVATAVAGLAWSTVMIGTLLTQLLWDTNYTANNDDWLNTTNLTYNAFNSSGLIQNWNSTGYISNWNSTGYIANWNASGLIANWSLASIVESF